MHLGLLAQVKEEVERWLSFSNGEAHSNSNMVVQHSQNWICCDQGSTEKMTNDALGSKIEETFSFNPSWQRHGV